MKFSNYQSEHAREYYNSKLKLRGAVELFNVRPPELLIFDNLLVFNKCFKLCSQKRKSDVLSDDLENTSFIDALGNTYKIYSCSLQVALSFAEAQNDSFESKIPIIALLRKLILGSDEKLLHKFVVDVPVISNIVVTSCPHPKNKFKFLYHLLMYFGRMECENQLFSEKDMLKAFVEGDLFKEENSDESKQDLMRKIILEQFAWLPISAKKLSNYITLTYESLEEFFDNGSIEFSSLCVSESSLKEKAADSIKQFIKEKRENNIKAVYD